MLQCASLYSMRIKKISAPLQGLDLESLKKNKALVRKNGTAKLVVSASDLNLDFNAVSEKAMKVVSQLQKHNFKAYLVGGCIRDLLLAKKPKDFDVSTDATPEQVRKIFPSNSRIIGRRFKIVHVIFGRNIIEVTTFRSNKVAPTNKAEKKFSTRISDNSGMLIRDNVYGKNIVEDSLRRDFTINALYLDPVKKEIYDYNGGLYDITQNVIDIIGDPQVRYSEDPVRMIRALRFSAKLNFKISKRTADPIKKLSSNLLDVSNARMFEEVNKLFLTGHGHESFDILRKYHIFELLFPATKEFLDNQTFLQFVDYALVSSDNRYKENKPNMPHFLYAVILWTVFSVQLYQLNQYQFSMVEPVDSANLIKNVLHCVLNEQQKVTAMPMAVSDSIKSLWRMQLRLTSFEEEENPNTVTDRNIFRAAFDFLCLRAKFEPFLESYVNFWQPYYQKSKIQAMKMQALKEPKGKKKRDKLEAKRGKKQTFATEGFEDEKNLSAKRKAQLDKARAWRASMNLSS